MESKPPDGFLRYSTGEQEFFWNMDVATQGTTQPTEARLDPSSTVDTCAYPTNKPAHPRGVSHISHLGFSR